MKLRIFVITALLVSGFLLMTTRTDWGQRRILNPVSGSGPLWSGQMCIRDRLTRLGAPSGITKLAAHAHE